MKRLIPFLIVLLTSTAWGQSWERPDLTKQGRVYYKPDRDMKVIAGDTLSAQTKSHFTLQKWGSLNSPAQMQIQQFIADPDSSHVEGDTIILFNGLQEQRIYPLADGLEWEIILHKKPPSNIFSFQIATSNLEFLYQGELTAKDSVRNAHRPDSVVSSYAVYHKAKAWNDYGTGKVCHIYRPRAWDVKNDTVWCDLNIDTISGNLSVTLPVDFWNNATYPVVIGPTFGYTSVGASNWGVALSWCYGVKYSTDHYTASAGDNVDTLYMYTKQDAGTDQAKLAIYDVSGGVPNNKTAESGFFTPGTTAAWHKIAVNIALSGGTTYSVAYGEMQDASIYRVYWDTQASAASEYNGQDLPATWVDNSTLGGRISMYAVYSTGAPAAAGQIIFINE